MDDLDDLLAGRDGLGDRAPVAFFSTALMNWRATGSETSASSSATRTSRMAVSTSASESAPLPVSLSKMPLRRS
jgi:hypothetical protein